MSETLQPKAMHRTMFADFMLFITMIIIAFSSLVGWYVFTSFNQVKEREQVQALNSLAKEKTRIINQHIANHLTQTKILGLMSDTKQAMHSFHTEFQRTDIYSPAYQQLSLKYDDFFKRFLASGGYYDLFLIDVDGNIIYTVKHERDLGTNLKSGPYRHTGLGKVFRQSMEMLQTNNSTFEYYEPSKRPSAFVATPLVRQGEMLGVIALEFNTDKFFHVINNLVGLGETGEIVVGQKIDNRIVITAPLRHDRDAAFQRTIDLDAANVSPIIASVQGKSGSGIVVDWRGEEVLAAWQYIPALNWGMVVKVDTQEAFGYWHALQKNILSYIGLGLMLCYLLLYVFLQRITKPLAKLTEASASFELGKEEIAIEPLLRMRNEVGDLANAFRKMVFRIQQSKTELEASVQGLSESNRLLDQEVAIGKINVAQLEKRESELKESNQELEQFAYIASHDLQEPLRKIQAFGDMLKNEADLNADTQNYLDRMQSASSRMSQLINDLLTYSRVNSKGGAFVSVDLQEIIQDAQDTLEIRIRDTDANITVDPLPVVDADPMQMRQLFQNLLGNALKYTREGVQPDIRISMRQPNGDDEYYVIVIEDNGIGFKPEQSERIFEMFQRLHSRSAYKGTGVGLAVCRRIVVRHGGKITASGEEGVGARFTVYLRKQMENNHE